MCSLERRQDNLSRMRDERTGALVFLLENENGVPLVGVVGGPLRVVVVAAETRGGAARSLWGQG